MCSASVSRGVVFQVDLPVDIPVLSICRGKSLLDIECVVVIRDGGVGGATSQPAPPSAKAVARFRRYLDAASCSNFTFDPDVAQTLEMAFVHARKDDPTVTQETFHSWLTLARLLATSHGENTLLPARWQELQRFEHERRSRLPKAAPAQSAPAHPTVGGATTTSSGNVRVVGGNVVS